jgi:hypothetical protein
MPQNTTDVKLTVRQERAIEHLLTGMTVSATAADLRVDRSTIHRWLREDADFQIVLNLRRREIVEAVQWRLITLVNAAIDALETALSNGDTQSSFKILSGLGLLNGSLPHIGPVDRKGIDLQEQLREHDDLIQRMGLLAPPA